MAIRIGKKLFCKSKAKARWEAITHRSGAEVHWEVMYQSSKDNFFVYRTNNISLNGRPPGSSCSEITKEQAADKLECWGEDLPECLLKFATSEE